MVTAGTQKRQAKATAQAEAEAAEFVDKAITDAVEGNGKRTRRTKDSGWPCTAEQIIEARDGKGLSWRQVATNLDLGSPGQARKAYSDLTGKPHNESEPQLRRAPRGSGTRGRKVDSPQWDDESDQDDIIERLQGPWEESAGKPGTQGFVPGHFRGSRIKVVRHYRGIRLEEDMRVQRVQAFAFDGKDQDGPLVVHMVTDSGMRCFRVADIMEVR